MLYKHNSSYKRSHKFVNFSYPFWLKWLAIVHGNASTPSHYNVWWCIKRSLDKKLRLSAWKYKLLCLLHTYIHKHTLCKNSLFSNWQPLAVVVYDCVNAWKDEHGHVCSSNCKSIYIWIVIAWHDYLHLYTHEIKDIKWNIKTGRLFMYIHIWQGLPKIFWLCISE